VIKDSHFAAVGQKSFDFAPYGGFLIDEFYISGVRRIMTMSLPLLLHLGYCFVFFLHCEFFPELLICEEVVIFVEVDAN
jgi:hypothetical protein